MAKSLLASDVLTVTGWVQPSSQGHLSNSWEEERVELKRKRKLKGEGKSGRKRPRANDYDVIPADPGKQIEELEPEGDQREGMSISASQM